MIFAAAKREALTSPSARVLTIGLGEGIARLANLALAVFLARRFGVRAVGAFALAQVIFLYLYQGTDFGLRHAGARMVAEDTENIAKIVRFIQHRRIALASVLTVAGVLYGKYGPVPDDARALVSLYSLAVFGYGLSVDWLAWGMQHFVPMSAWRASVYLFSLLTTLLSVLYFHAGLLAAPVALVVSYILSDAVLWFCWATKSLSPQAGSLAASTAIRLPGWKATTILGTGLLAHQAFYSIDTVMLGSLTDSAQTGLYSAAYRLFNLLLAIYTLGIQAIYPRLAAIPQAQRNIRSLRRPLLIAGACGIASAAVLELVRKPMIELIYGHAFSASATLAGPVLLAIPLDFVTALLLNALMAWDRPKRILAATATALAGNVLLNAFLIPRFGAMGAAIATPLSYLPFAAQLFWQMQHIGNAPGPAGDPVLSRMGESA
jgi:O-antigen/teichoic acid export membrane protein